jgi:hypothetical protein
MANSFNSDDTQIIFNSKNLLDKCSWVVNSGMIGVSDNTINMGPYSSCKCILKPKIKAGVQYLKISCLTDSISKSIYTDVSKNCLINISVYTNNKERPLLINYYFPSFVYEYTYINNIVDNSSTFSIDSNIIDSIEITINNNYNDTVIFSELILNYCAVAASTSEVIEELTDSSDFKDQVTSWVSDALINNAMTLVIPLVDSLPDLDSVPDGYICRVHSDEES